MFNRILVLVDDTERTLAAVEAALELARPAEGHVTFLCLLTVVSAVPPSDSQATFMTPGQVRLNAEAAAGEVLANSARRAQLAGVRCSGMVGTGHHDMVTVLNAARDDASDVLVLARPRVIDANLAPGASLIDQLSVHSRIPILLV